VAAVTRKQIEEYYHSEWNDMVASKTLNLLIELTCKTYQLNQPPIPDFIKDQDKPKPHNLGQI